MKVSVAAVVLLAGCVYVPRTVVVYDPACRIEAKHMTMEVAQIGQLGHCQGGGCVAVLAGAGAVATSVPRPAPSA